MEALYIFNKYMTHKFLPKSCYTRNNNFTTYVLLNKTEHVTHCCHFQRTSKHLLSLKQHEWEAIHLSYFVCIAINIILLKLSNIIIGFL